MKELSIEEKAKRYDKALDEAKAIHKAIKQDLKPVIEQIFPELKESEGEKIRKQIISFLKDFEHDHYRSLDFSSWIAWLEKQGEQKSINDLTQQEAMNIADTKFKIGDWIVYNRNDHSRKIMQIYDIRDNRYYFNDNIHFSWSVKECDEKSHLWTIKDVKDGDVLCIYECDEPKIVFIFKGILKKHCALSYHCYYNIMYPYFSGSEKGCLVSNNEDVKPATKEQRDLLFQKMKESN